MIATTGPGFRVERVAREDGVEALRFAGELRFRPSAIVPAWSR